MPSNDGEGERADGGVETVDFDALEDDDLPEWATEEASVPAAEPTNPEPTDTPAQTDTPEPTPDDPPSEPAPESEERASEPTPGSDDAGADEPVDAATAVNFANVETGASASVSVGWSRTEADYGDTGGTSIDPDLDDVDPGALLDEIDDGEFPRPGAPDAGDGADAADAGESTATDHAAPTTATSSRTTTGSAGVAVDPPVAFGVGAVVLLVAAVLYLLLSAVLPATTAVLAVGAALVGAGAVGLGSVVGGRA